MLIMTVAAIASDRARMELPYRVRFYSPHAEITVGRNRLPHWDQQGRTYALTFRLADAVPAALLRRLRLEEADWRQAHPEPWTPDEEREHARQFTGVVERWMDAGMGDCVLADAGCARIVVEALQFFEAVRTRLHAWVVMPNHVHALAEILDGHTLSEVMESWKGFTARRINERLGRSGRRAIMIAWCETGRTSGMWCATSGGIRRRRDWRLTHACGVRVIWR